MDDATGGPLHDRIRGRKEGTSDVLAPCGDTLRVVTMPTVRDLSTVVSGVGARVSRWQKCDLRGSASSPSRHA